jgi:integrase
MKKKRRQRHTGSIFKKPPCKKFVIQFYKNGKRIREATGTTDYGTAKKLLRQRLHEIDKNEYLARHGKPARVEDLYAALLEHNRVNRIGRVLELPGRWKHLNPVFGALAAAQLTTDEIRHYIRNRQDAGAANATINHELATLKRMFNLGTECTPPKVRVVPHIPMLKEAKPRQGFVEDAEFSRLTAETSELWLRTFLELGFTYGWRRAELLGLRVRQVNLATGTIRLDVGTTKNGEGREVTMTAKVAELLREAVIGKSPESFVLTRRGKPIRNLQQAGGASAFGLASARCSVSTAALRSWRGRGANAARTSASIAASSRTICGVQRPRRRAGRECRKAS